VKAFSLLLCLVASAAATIQTVSDLTADRLVGTWEAIAVKDGLPFESVYQISFTAPDAAYFVGMSSKDALSPPSFLGKLSSSNLAKGHIRLQFSAIGDSTDYYCDQVAIDGRATRSGDEASIEGTITLHLRNGKTSTERVLFANKRWVQDFVEISKRAQEILHNAQIHH